MTTEEYRRQQFLRCTDIASIASAMEYAARHEGDESPTVAEELETTAHRLLDLAQMHRTKREVWEKCQHKEAAE